MLGYIARGKFRHRLALCLANHESRKSNSVALLIIIEYYCNDYSPVIVEYFNKIMATPPLILHAFMINYSISCLGMFDVQCRVIPCTANLVICNLTQNFAQQNVQKAHLT